MKNKKYFYNPPRFEYLGAFELGMRAGKISPVLTEKVNEWEWNSPIPIFFIFYDYEEKEYVLFSYHFKKLTEPVIDDHKLINYSVVFTFNEIAILPGSLFQDKVINRLIKFIPKFGVSSRKMDLWVAQYMIAREGDTTRGMTEQEFFFEPKKTGHDYAPHEIEGRINANVEAYITDFAEPFKDFEFE